MKETYFQDLCEAKLVLNQCCFLRVQDGQGKDKVEVLAGQVCPHHLLQQENKAF